MATVTVPVTAAFLSLVAANIVFMNWLNSRVDGDASLHYNFDVPGFK
jgi:hypothetical protein